MSNGNEIITTIITSKIIAGGLAIVMAYCGLDFFSGLFDGKVGRIIKGALCLSAASALACVAVF